MLIGEIHHNSEAVKALAVQNTSAGGDVDGEIIDTAFYEAAEFMFGAETITTADVPIVLYESDDSGMAGATQVSAEEQLGTPTLTSTALIARLGYIGKKRYVRPRLQTGTAVMTSVHGECLLVNAMHQPTAEQPAA